MSPAWAAQREERFVSLFALAEPSHTYYSGHGHEGTSSICLQRLMAQRVYSLYINIQQTVVCLPLCHQFSRDRKEKGTDQTVTPSPCNNLQCLLSRGKV